MRFLRRSLTGLLLLAVTLALLALAAQTVRTAVETRMARENMSRPARERVFAVNLIAVTPEAVAPVLEAFGEVRARRSLEVRAQAGGSVVELGTGFEEGGRVEAGQLLLRVDPTDRQDALALARTDLAEAEAETRDAAAALDIAGDDLASARRQADLRAQALARQRDLATRGVATEAQVETAALAAATAEQAVLSRRSALANAEARVAQADNRLARSQIALEEAERRLAETEITAEFSGRLSGVSAVEGRIVTANEKVATLVDPTALEVSFRLSTAQYARLVDESGQLLDAEVTARLAVSGVDLLARGRVDRESAEVGEGQTGRLIFARLESAPGFRPGDFITVEIEEPVLANVARLPATAVGAAGTVLVLGENDRLEEVPVEVIRRQGDSVLVRAEAVEGREVVIERTPMLGAGILVRPLREGGEAPEAGAGGGQGAGAGQGGGGGGGEMIALDDERRARLIAFVRTNQMMPVDAKERILNQLNAPEVPVSVVERLEGRMGG
ncbi:efflux RND transporter periplasmic adaptor subunit [Maritimibacter sp. HL-12]|uniref:efflux RND transporter periplasmic adaptor subunit n=1 Tax=Maritimibacter sp. HL-12 TaxID=1162418 RepID=UPI000A0EFA88|nr:HlyD family efflux transporter periplasmic adaptor subunit [Maritimibacter sp. HL-12]SMH48009.1 Multidrug resistance efflux pump [Maritimibacter sp. HL-12]